MNNFWTIIPRAVRKSKILTEEEKGLWYEIAENLNSAGCCKLTNNELAKSFETSPRTITNWISSLKRKGYLCVTQETHNHTRRLYPKYPGEIDERKPSAEEMEVNIDKLQEACQKGIKLDEFQLLALMNKIRGSWMLDEWEDHTIQFVPTLNEMKFLVRFMELFPGKEIDMQLSSVAKPIDYEMLLYEVQRSKFLRTSNNISLKWLIDNYDDIVTLKKYAPFQNETVREKFGRDYTREELNALIPSVDEVEI